MDALGTPLPNGVNDLRLGPQDSAASNAPCVTCCQRHQFCPGHFGHIELCVPVYHPLLFGKIVELLRIKCLACHKITARQRDLNIFKVKAILLQQGNYSQAVDLDRKMAACRHAAKEELGAQGSGDGDRNNTMTEAMAGQAIDQLLRETLSTLKKNRSTSQYIKRSTPPSTFEGAYMRDLVKSLIATCKAAKNCPHCDAYSPKIRQDSSNKIFQSPLSATARRVNASSGHELRPALTKGSNNSNKKYRQDGVDGTADSSGDVDMGYDSDVNRNIDMDVDDRSDDDGNDEEDEDNNDDNANDDAINSRKDKYMSAAEVQAQVRRTWETNPELCDALFATQGCEIFFMQAIPVPPNRFRPSMHLGGMVVENAQNAFLNKIIQANEVVRTNFANNEQAAAYKSWIELQTHINCFMDSSKDPSANMNPTMGIRQILERKEGIFRKHMMGKRVNFACRSVISPDPYIGTNEIGLPRYFAETLTYPTPVTDINISEMRELVERGPFRYPGARWVEINNQRMDLSKQDDHQRHAIAARLLTHARRGRPAIVGRQLRDGDMVLMNRQVSRRDLRERERESENSHFQSKEEAIVMHHSELVFVRL
jgi:DNA-directed RNA polymerase I subunit RPA1